MGRISAARDFSRITIFTDLAEITQYHCAIDAGLVPKYAVMGDGSRMAVLGQPGLHEANRTGQVARQAKADPATGLPWLIP